MESNNLEFRIWDNREKRWMVNQTTMTQGSEIILIDQKGGVWVFHYAANWNTPRCLQPHDATGKRFEISQCIFKEDSKGVKAFTGDTIKLSVRKSGQVTEEVGEISMWHGNAYFAVNGVEKYVLTAVFTIIGNKWQGISSQKEANLSGSSGDSTVQQQSVISFSDILNNSDFIKEKREHPILYIPYQICPKCYGEGFVGEVGISTSLHRVCPVCNGAKVIVPYIPLPDKS